MEAPPLERKLVAILAADVEGYSRMMEIDEEGTLATLSSHRLITDELIAQHGGRIFGTAGDSVLAEFASVFAAVQCAARHPERDRDRQQGARRSKSLRFRIGINVGDVMVKDGDILRRRRQHRRPPRGARRARAASAFHAVCEITSATSCRTGFEDLGEQAVKNIAQPVRCYPPVRGPRASPSRRRAPSRYSLQSEPAQGTECRGHPMPKAVELVFWESIKDSPRATDYEAYLEQYPDGAFVALARARLDELNAAATPVRDPKDREIELAYWDSVRELNNPESLLAYLDKYPDGEFRALAEIRLKELADARAA
jgi:class 3 adenylate cyclase